MESQRLLIILLVLTVLVGYGWSQFLFGTVPPRIGVVRLFLGEENANVSNFSMIPAGLFHDKDVDGPGGAISVSVGTDGQNDGLWCQSSLNESMIGTWYLPNGDIVPRVESSPLYSNNTPTGQIGLLRRGGIANIQGLYRCVIPNEEGVNQTLYVAAYGSDAMTGEFDDPDPPLIESSKLTFQLLSSVYADSLVYSLSFNVTDRPPTIVTCTMGGNLLSIPENDLIRTVLRSEDNNTNSSQSILVQVSIILRTRVAAVYQCHVTTERIAFSNLVASTMPMESITLSPTPTDFDYIRQLTSVELSWNSSSSDSYYQLLITNRAGVETSNFTTDNGLVLTLQLDDEYTIKLVDTGGDLPSGVLNVTVPQVVNIEIGGTAAMPLDQSSNFSLNCTLVVAPELDDTVVEINWADQDLTPFNSTADEDIVLDSLTPMMTSVNNNTVYTHILKFDGLQPSQVGSYTCGALFGGSALIRREFSVSIQVPTPVVVSSVNTTGRIFESSDVSLLCNVTVAPLDVDSVVNITWFGPNGMITADDTHYSISSGMLDSTTYGSLLTFTTALSDDGSQYYCTASYGANETVPQSSLIYSSTATSDNTTVFVEIVPSPMVSVKAVGIPVTTESFALVCTGSAPPNVSGLAIVSVQWQLGGAELTNSTLEGVSVTNSGSMASLNFSSLDNATHEKDYVCVATLSIIDVPITRNSSTIYTLMTLSNPIVSISSSGSIIAGTTLTLECTVTIVAGDLNITWLNGTDGDELTEGNGIMFNLVTMSSTVQVYQLIFNPLDYSHIGGYTCQANLTVGRGDGEEPFIGRGSDSTIVSVQVPVPQVAISPIMTPLIRGTERTITCVVTFTPPLPDNPDASFNVFKDGVDITFVNDTRQTAVRNGTTGSLTFRPLDFSDSGNYTCVAIARDFYNNPLIIPSNASDYYNATVEAIPVPVVTFTATPSSQLVGESLVLNCTVDVLDDLYDINVDVRIVRNDGVVITNDTGSGDATVDYTLNLLRASDAGRYQCLVNITQDDIDYQFIDTESTQVNLTLPTPSVVVEYNATGHLVAGELAEGQFLDLMCVADLGQYVDIDVTVTMTWMRDNMPLTNGDGFNITAPVMSGSNSLYTGVLRINSLRDERDNSASYNCLVNVVPNVPFVSQGSDNSSAVTLTVANFGTDHVSVDIIIPAIPVAGDKFSLTCQIVLPPNSVENVTLVRWTYDLEASRDVTADNTDASLAPFVKNGNTFTSVLTLDPVKTSDATRYYCHASIAVFGVVDRTDRYLTVQIFPPSVSLAADPPTGSIYESTAYQLNCTATVNTTIVNTPVTASVVWTDPRGMTIPVNNPRRVVVAPDSNLVSSLLFLPIDIGHFNDNGTYTCEMTLNSPNSLITSSQPTSTTINVTVERLPTMTVVFSSVGSVEVGQSLTVTCTITTVARLAVTPNVIFIKMNETDMEMLSDLDVPYTITTVDTGAVTNYTLMFNPLRFEDAGMYTCMAEFNVTGFNNTDNPATATGDMQEASDVFNLTVDFPPVTVTISKEHNDTLYAGTPFFLNCDIIVSPLVTVPFTVTNQWTRNSTVVPMGLVNDTITDELNMIDRLNYNATLSFYPLDNANDSGIYNCSVQVFAPPSYQYIRIRIVHVTIRITVQATPNPVVQIVTDGNAEPGELYKINCTVTVVSRLIVPPVITWTKTSTDDVISVMPVRVIESETRISLCLTFSSLKTSDAAMYTCKATITVSQINMVTRSISYVVLSLTIPIPILKVTLSRQYYLLAGSALTVTCVIPVDPNVDTPIIVYVSWNMTDQSVMSSGDTGDDTDFQSMMLGDMDRVNISSVMNTSGFNEYRSQVVFSTLSSTEDSGTYTCIVKIKPWTGYDYVMPSDTNNMNVTFTVTDPMIGNFSASPDSFLGLETSCPDSDPYDNFTLTCTATKPTIVIPDLVLEWTHNGTLETGRVVTTGTDTAVTTVTNTLSFPNTTASDTGTYRCVARIEIPDSTTITTSEESTTVLRLISAPVVATNVISAAGATTANISFIIPNIAYTPENYTIRYTGETFQTNENTSMLRMSSDNISMVNESYMFMLGGLEEANTYTYTVDSANCNGTTSTAEMNFTTVSTLPVAPPIDCTNTTFLPLSATLNWIAPVCIDQNGAPVGYNLTCTNDTGGIAVSGLDPTQSSTDTMFTVTDVMPFTAYTCELRFINVIGQGPPAQCRFKTAQDRPYSAPQNFASTSTMTTVTFTWNRPLIPNGIITEYFLNVTNLETMTSRNYTISVTPNQTFATRTVDASGFFRAYENYTATVTGSTHVGFGPMASTAGRTEPDISSPPLLVTRTVNISNTFFTTTPMVDNVTINVTWSPPSIPNGAIMRYGINVTSTGSNTIMRPIENDGKASFTELINGLSPGVPYNVSLVAYNEFGRGRAVEVVVFTRVLAPSVSPTITNSTRSSDGSWIYIEWRTITFDQARGFFEYTIILSQRSAPSRKRQSGDRVVRVPYNETSVNVTDLDTQATYGVAMGLSVDDGSGQPPIAGPNSETIEVTSPASTPPPSSTPSGSGAVIGIVVGLVVAIFLIILIVVVIIVIVLRSRRSDKLTFGGNSKKKRDLFEVLESVPMTPTGTTGFRQLDEPPDLNGGAGGVETTDVDGKDEAKDKQDDRLDEEMILERMKPIAVASFHEHVQQMHVDSDKGFETEYKSVPMQTGSNFDIGRNEGNKTKNRFANIFPYDFSRVKLTELPDSPDSDYINACYIDGYNRKDCYIAAQGPLPSTITDFWRMIWEYRINHIVMLTGVIEGGKKKCEQYWPEKIGESLELQNGMVITMTSSVQFADYVIRDFKASKADSDEKDLVISHYHFTSWPDHGVPQFATSLISFIKRVQKDHNKDKNIPLLVHCSAGVGRTGTLVMLDVMMDRLKAEESINVYEVLRQLRSKRMYMVQTQAQYVFLHDALDELTTCGDTAIIGSNLRARVNKMHKLIPGKNITGFHEQFELLEQVGYKPSEITYSDGTSAINVPKNRYPSIVPLNNHRPRLRPDGSAGSDYINASFVDGYKQRNAYLVTQGPLKSTVDDFWRMMMEFKSRTIVQLCNTVEEGEEKCQMYWPTKEGEPVEYGRIKVTLQSETTSGDYVTRKLHICNEKGGKSERDGQVVTQFHYTSWPEHGHPASTGSIIELIDLLTRAQMNTGNKAITVVCNDGVGRTGAFLCIHSQLERLKTEGEVDVFKYLKTARTRRIGLLSELDHYVFCHEVLADFVESFDPYANFKTDM